jgi:hypothetical protein
MNPSTIILADLFYLIGSVVIISVEWDLLIAVFTIVTVVFIITTTIAIIGPIFL